MLDIFGFEVFSVNGLEQLCINYSNEKLQNHFNEHIFKLEQEEYRNDGVSIEHTEFVDNQPIVQLIAGRNGIFSLMDEELKLPRGSDTGFLARLGKRHTDHPHLGKVKPKRASTQFAVVHFAGEVGYTVTQMLSKNKDALHADLKRVIESSDVLQVMAQMKKQGLEPDLISYNTAINACAKIGKAEQVRRVG